MAEAVRIDHGLGVVVRGGGGRDLLVRGRAGGEARARRGVHGRAGSRRGRGCGPAATGLLGTGPCRGVGHGSQRLAGLAASRQRRRPAAVDGPGIRRPRAEADRDAIAWGEGRVIAGMGEAVEVLDRRAGRIGTGGGRVRGHACGSSVRSRAAGRRDGRLRAGRRGPVRSGRRSGCRAGRHGRRCHEESDRQEADRNSSGTAADHRQAELLSPQRPRRSRWATIRADRGRRP